MWFNKQTSSSLTNLASSECKGDGSRGVSFWEVGEDETERRVLGKVDTHAVHDTERSKQWEDIGDVGWDEEAGGTEDDTEEGDTAGLTVSQEDSCQRAGKGGDGPG